MGNNELCYFIDTIWEGRYDTVVYRIYKGYNRGISNTHKDNIIIEQVSNYHGKLALDDIRLINIQDIYNQKQMVEKIQELLNEQDKRRIQATQQYEDTMQEIKTEREKVESCTQNRKIFDDFRLELTDITSFDKAEEILCKYKYEYREYTSNIYTLDSNRMDAQYRYEETIETLNKSTEYLQKMRDKLEKEEQS